jgi:anti-sigma regulatory factor (Ser/Thr protein kinase)
MKPEERRVELDLAADAEAPRRARAAIDRLAGAAPGDIRFRARLLASELVANSVMHCEMEPHGRVGLTVVREDGLLRVEVRDGGTRFDSLARLVSERASSGRGLRLVAALADRWGVEHEGGNIVWFEIDELAREDREPRPSPSAGTAQGPARPGADADGDGHAQAAVVLARAAGLIREGWCRQTDARDTDGNPVEPWSEQAAAWSLLGAIVAALDGPAAVRGVPLQALAVAMAALAELIEERSLQGWNDTPARTQTDVIGVLERARVLVLGQVTAN